MTKKEAPPGRRPSRLASADSRGVNRKRRWANPEKSGGAKSRSCRAGLSVSGPRYASRTAIGKPRETAGHKGWTFPV